MKKPSQEHVEIGDSLRGELIAVEAADIDRIRYGAGSGRHNIQFTKLHRRAFCVIEIPMKSLQKKLL